MQFDEISQRINYLEELIRKESTGTPAVLAKRLNVSERMIYRYISHLNTRDDNVKYCKRTKTYKYLKKNSN